MAYCPNCNSQIPMGARNCPNCGMPLSQERSIGYSPEYAPLSPWQYFGYQLLFAIPVVGFIFLIIFSFDNSNINRRNYARSFFCILILTIIVTAIIAAVGGLAGLGVLSRLYY